MVDWKITLFALLLFGSEAFSYNVSGDGDPAPDFIQRLPRMDYQYVGDWSPYKGRSAYYQTAPDDGIKSFQPRYQEDSYIVTQKQDNECKEVRSGNFEDGLTQITNVVVKISKLLFGAFVTIMVPLILTKTFLLPLKIMLVLKLLFKLFLFWPIFSRIFGGLSPTTSVLAKFASPSDVDLRYLIDTNDTRIERSMADDYDISICDVKIACFVTKTIASKNYLMKLVISSAMLFDYYGTKMHNIAKILKNKRGYEDCFKIECHNSAVQK